MCRVFDFFPACKLGMDLLPSALHRHSSLPPPNQLCPQSYHWMRGSLIKLLVTFLEDVHCPDRYFVFRNRRISRITRSL
jgi:hypothetical protein